MGPRSGAVTGQQGTAARSRQRPVPRTLRTGRSAAPFTLAPLSSLPRPTPFPPPRVGIARPTDIGSTGARAGRAGGPTPHAPQAVHHRRHRFRLRRNGCARRRASRTMLGVPRSTAHGLRSRSGTCGPRTTIGLNHIRRRYPPAPHLSADAALTSVLTAKGPEQPPPHPAGTRGLCSGGALHRGPAAARRGAAAHLPPAAPSAPSPSRGASGAPSTRARGTSGTGSTGSRSAPNAPSGTAGRAGATGPSRR